MMRLPKMDHVAPATMKEACSLLNRHAGEARILAGGTDLLVACKLQNIRPALLVSLGVIPGLKGIRFREKEGLTIGAMTTLHELRHHPAVLDHYPALAQAAASVGSVQLQFMGTVGGNLLLNTRCIYYNQSHMWRRSRAVCFKMGGDVCHVVPKGERCYAVSSADTAPVLIALDARARLVSSNGERVVAVKDLYTGDGKEPLILNPSEVLSEINLPVPTDRQISLYFKYRQRRAIDFPLAGVAVRMNVNGDGLCKNCRVVLTAVDSRPTVAFQAGDLFQNRVPTVDLIAEATRKAVEAAHPIKNVFGGKPAYRRKMVGILTRRALLAAANRLGFL
jgi:4-hydroxybenzoyl-CoA reductase subunit beta